MKRKLLILIFLMGISISMNFGKDIAENDLRITTMGFNTTNVEEGKSYELTIFATNYGTNTSESADLKIYFTNTPWSLNDAILLKDTYMGPIEPGKSRGGGSYVSIPTNYSYGTSFLVGVLEHKGVKRYKTLTLTIQLLPRPDLTSRLYVANNYINGAYYVSLDSSPLVYLIEIENIGNKISGAAIHELWMSTDTELNFNDDRILRGIHQPEIEPGGSYTLNLQYINFDSRIHSPGTYYLFTYVDRQGEVVESNENNNINPPSLLYKLIITEPVFRPRKPILYTINTEVYPNPTSGLINFSNDQEESKAYSLTDLNGRVIKEGVINSFEKLELNIRNEASGLYYLKIISEDKEIELHKIVKN